MERLLDNFSIQNNFWKHSPQFLAIKAFRELHDDDKKDKKRSSNIMWAIALLEHPESIMKELSEEDRKELIAKEYLLEPDFQWDAVADLRERFSQLAVSKPLRSLRMWEKKLEERDEFISNTKYSMDTADSLDKIMANTERLYKHYKAIKEDLMRTDLGAAEKGGGTPSLSDTGEI